MVLTKRRELASVLLTRTYHSTYCDTDHSLVASKVRIAPRKLHHSKKKGWLRVNTCCTSNSAKTQHFLNCLDETLARETSEDDATESKWVHLRDAVYSAVITAYGKKARKNADWFEAHWEEMEPVTEAKRKALLAYKTTPSPSTLADLKAARKASQQTARHCANTYWLNLCSSIQTTADTGNARGMYEGIKKATGPAPSKSAPLKSKTGEVITDQAKQFERWVEHYLELYATQNVITDAALAAIPDLPVMEKLDTPPTEEELSKAINSLASGKSPGSDSIPAEVLKSGKPALLEPLQILLCRCWEEGYIPQDMRDATIVTLYKNKGDRSDCSSYRGISLLGFTISLKKTNVMAQGTDHPPTITIDGHVLKVVDDFTYLGSTISSSLTLEAEISSRIVKAATVMSKLHQRVWNNPSLTVKTKLRVCQACVLSTLLYSSEAWTLYAR